MKNVKILSKLTLDNTLIGLVLVSAAALLIPAVFYSASTEFGLVDDFYDWYTLQNLSTWEGAKKWFVSNALTFEKGRFRPIFDLYNLFVWGVFGNHPALHHLMRLLLKIVTGLFSVLAICRYCEHSGKKDAKGLCGLVFSITFFFFPNAPDARLAPQETLVALFLSLSVFALVRQIFLPTDRVVRNCAIAAISLLCLSGSKETAIPLSLALSFFFVLILLLQKNRLWIPFAVVTLVGQMLPIVKIIAVMETGGYGVKSAENVPLSANLEFFAKRLFLWQASPVFGILFLAAPSIFLLIHSKTNLVKTVVRLIKNRTLQLTQTEWSNLTLVFVAMLWVLAFLISLTSWRGVLRYGYPAVYLLCVVLGFSVVHLGRHRSKRLIAVYCLLFLMLNAYNFLYQYANQYASRRVEAGLRAEIKAFMDDGRKVASSRSGERSLKLQDYFNFFLPYYEEHHENIQLIRKPFLTPKRFDAFVCPEDRTCKAKKPPKGFVTHRRFLVDMNLTALNVAKKVSKLLDPRKLPYHEVDGGGGPRNWIMFRKLEPHELP